MTVDAIIVQLRQQLKAVKKGMPEDLPEDSHFAYQCNLDSLDLVEFVARIEQEFEILIPDQDLAELTSLHATARYVHSHLTP
jgi:acyl carrier protein